MFDNLIETKKKKERTIGGTIISVVIHTIAVGAAVYGTLNAREAILEKPKAEKVDFVEVKKEEPKQEPEKAPPLAKPAVNVKAGDVILSVNGQPALALGGIDMTCLRSSTI